MGVFSAIFCLFIDSILVKITELSIYQNLDRNLNAFDNLYDKLFWVFSSVIVGPTSEEILFRMPLSKRKRNFLFAVVFNVFYFSRGKISVLNIEDFAFFHILIAIGIYVLLVNSLKETHFQKLRIKYFNFMCWGLMLAFSWLHISNFQPIHWQLIYLYPIYVLSQFFSAIGFSFLMVKYKNIIWPILLHMLINSTALILRSIH